jgi:hypothetical protein
MFLAIKEKRFAKRIVKRLLKSHAAVSRRKPDLLSGALYREVLLHSKLVDVSLVDQVLQQAEDSADLWTTSSMDVHGFRQVAHFFVVSQYQASGKVGAVVSFREIVYSMIPVDM